MLNTAPLSQLPVLDPEHCWDAVVARDARADGRFFFAVKTTGIVCRPSCSARRPRRENVEFHASLAAAQAAGFRPCKRCRPDRAGQTARHADAIAHACRALATDGEAPPLAELARAAGLSAFHFHRLFKQATGVTPKAYAAAARARRLQQVLGEADSVTAALYASGFNSNARFYAAVPRTLGMQPTRYRAGGRGETIRFALGVTSLGAILVAATARGLCMITLGDDASSLLGEFQDTFPHATLVGGDAAFESWVARVVGMIEAPAQNLDLPLDLRGTAFQARVWQALSRIPPGTTASYAEIAKLIGAPRATRAVARACASNRLAVAIPCHRVVRQDGSLSGYRWGIERKRALLEREARG